jgi:hypothetical protein
MLAGTVLWWNFLTLGLIPSVGVLFVRKILQCSSRMKPGANDFAYNPSYSGGRDQEDCGLKPAPGK